MLWETAKPRVSSVPWYLEIPLQPSAKGFSSGMGQQPEPYLVYINPLNLSPSHQHREVQEDAAVCAYPPSSTYVPIAMGEGVRASRSPRCPRLPL